LGGGAKVTGKDKQGRTALHIAAILGNAPMVSDLL
jgi:ankyrin repeat protein